MGQRHISQEVDGDVDEDVAPHVLTRRRRTFRNIRSLEAAAIAGVAYSVLSVIGLTLLAGFPTLSLDDADLTAWFDDGGNQASLILGLNVATMSSVAFLWFVAVIRRRVGVHEDRFFATVFLGSALAYVGVWLSGAVALAAPAVAMTMLDAGSVSSSSASQAGGVGAAFILIVAPRLEAVFVLSCSSLIMRAGVLPRWLWILGYAAGVVLFVVPILWRPLSLFFPLWVFVVSVAIVLHRPDPAGGSDVSDAAADG
ncbi:MAG: hypothetical protein QNM02_00330 [Acidimicrobiia bacterium]|nr:hypothetical protein [Acidimicrobiia bacterium]